MFYEFGKMTVHFNNVYKHFILKKHAFPQINSRLYYIKLKLEKYSKIALSSKCQGNFTMETSSQIDHQNSKFEAK